MAGIAEFVVGVVVGLSLAALAWIVVAPSRRVRADGPLAPEVEAQLLLGQEPERPGPEDAEPPVPHPREYDTGQLQALRRLNGDRKGRRRSER